MRTYHRSFLVSAVVALAVVSCGSSSSNPSTDALALVDESLPNEGETSHVRTVEYSQPEARPGTLRWLMTHLPSLRAARPAPLIDDLEVIGLGGGVSWVLGHVTSVEILERETSLGGVSAAELIVRVGIKGTWTDAATGESERGERHWDTVAWSGPPDATWSALTGLKAMAAEVQLDEEVLLVFRSDESGEAMSLLLGLIESGGVVETVTIGDGGALGRYSTIDEARRALEAAASSD